MSHLVIDVGTSGVRAGIVRPDATVDHSCFRHTLPTSPLPDFVEFDPLLLAEAALDVARQALELGGPVASVGIANQRASTVVWERSTGEPVGPGVSWQDLRTIGTCLLLRAQGIRLAPNASATKLGFLLDLADPDRARDLCFGTVDTWLVWCLTEGRAHVTDLSNAAVTGLLTPDASGWDQHVLQALRIPESVLPEVVDSSSLIEEATALPGAPLISGIAGDQQASLLGQGCTEPGRAKITFGTGGMLDVCVGGRRPAFEMRGEGGAFPIVAWRRDGEVTWGIEAIMLSAGTSVEWLRDGLGLLASAAESEVVASACDDTGDVWFVPALAGLGTPMWDFGARGTLVGLSRKTGRSEITRAVLEGVAHAGVDLVEAAEADAGLGIEALRVDGGMTANRVFVQALADAAQRPVEVSPVLEATTLGAAFLAGLATGTWRDFDEVAATWRPSLVVEPARRPSRERWRAARERAAGWVPELSALEF